MKTKTFLLLAIGVVIGLVVVVLVWVGIRPHSFTGTILQAESPAMDFELISSIQKPIRLSDFRGKLVVLYFGYTFCPDVCPASMSTLAKAMAQLGRKADDIQVIMISVDPERDTPDKLAEYVTKFDPSFIGATGTIDEISAVASLYGVFFQKDPGTPETGYLVSHTSSVLVIDREGHLRLIFPFDTSADAIAADLGELLND